MNVIILLDQLLIILHQKENNGVLIVKIKLNLNLNIGLIKNILIINLYIKQNIIGAKIQILKNIDHMILLLKIIK